MPILDLQKRFMELGRIRLGDKGDRGQPQKLSKFRLTSASKPLLESAAAVYGGEVRPWEGAPDEGEWELYTDTDSLRVVMPPTFSPEDGAPTHSWSQWYELWSRGGCQRRCNGQTEMISGDPCLCNPDDRDCAIVTQINVILPDVAGIGVWRLRTSGYYAAVETTGTLELLQQAAEHHTFIEANLRMEQRSVKKPNKPPLRFVVPVIELPQTRVADLLPGSVDALQAPRPKSGPAPSLPTADNPTPSGREAQFEIEAPSPEWSPPELPAAGDSGGEGVTNAAGPAPEVEPPEQADPLTMGEAGLQSSPSPPESLMDQLVIDRRTELEQLLERLGQAEHIGQVREVADRFTSVEYMEWIDRQIERAQSRLAEAT